MVSTLFKKRTSLLVIILLIFSQLSAYAIDVEIEDPTPDLEAPTLNSINSSSKELTPTSPVKVSADITDELSGVKSANIYYRKPSGQTRSFSLVYNSVTNKYETNISVGLVDEPGEWKVSYVQLYDKKNNSVSVNRSLFDFTNIDLTVSGVTLPEVVEQTDKEAPILHDILVASQKVRSGEEIKVIANISDNESGVNSATVYYKKPSGRTFSITLSKNSTTGKFEGSRTINQFQETGEWEISYVTMSDKANNSTSVKSYTDSENKLQNFNHCTVEVTETTPDLQGPSLDDLAIEIGQLTASSAVVKLTAKVSDELSGVSWVTGSYTKPSGRTAALNFSRNGDVYIASVPIDKYDELGKWELKYISTTDNMDNQTIIYDRNDEKYFNGFDINVNGKITISPGFPFSIELNTKSLSLKEGEGYQLQTYLNFTDKSKKDITKDSLTVYTSSDPTLVSVDKSGMITIPVGARAGYAVVEVSYGDISKNLIVEVNGGNETAYLKITPQSKKLSAGQEEQINVIEMRNGLAKDISSSVSGINYTSQNPLLVSVSPDGVIKVSDNAESGTVIIQVSYGELKGEVKINISKPTIRSLVVSPTEESLSLTSSKLQLVVKAFMSNGTTKDITNASEGTIYTSSNPDIASVSPDGYITIPSNAKSGIVTIKVINSSLSTMTVLTVEGNPELVGLNLDEIPAEMVLNEERRIILKSEWSDGKIKEIPLENTIFTSSRKDRVDLSRDGVLQAFSPGATNIEVVYEGKIFQKTIMVLPSPSILNFFHEGSLPSVMKIGEEISISDLKVLLSDETISDVEVKDVIFRSSRPDRIFISDTGVLKALSSGTSNIEIVYQGKIISHSIKVEAGPEITGIYLETAIPAELISGKEHDLGVVKAKWSDGSESILDNENISYSSSRPDRVSVSEDGVLKALSPGSSNLEIRYQGKVISSSVKVAAGPTLMSLALVENIPTTLNIGDIYTVGTIKAKWSDGSETIIDNKEVSYTSSRPDRISVTDDSFFKALSAGSSNLEIRYQGKAILASMKVTAGPTLMSLALMENMPTTLNIGDIYTVGTIKAKWSDGSETIIDNKEISYTSSRPDRISVTEDGIFKALSAGSSNLEIRYQGKAILASMKVAAGPTLMSLTLEDNIPTTLYVGDIYTIGTIKAKWSDGSESIIDNKEILYTSSRPDRMSVVEDGVFKALSIGSTNLELRYQGKVIFASVKVTAGPILMSLTPAENIPTTLIVGDVYTVGVIKAKWSDGSESIIDNKDISYSSSRSDRLSVSDEGILRALSIGSSNLEIKYQGKVTVMSVKVSM